LLYCTVLNDFIHYPDFVESGLSTEELTQKVFAGLANGKAHVTSKDLRNWDLVHVLLAEVRIVCVLFPAECYLLSVWIVNCTRIGILKYGTNLRSSNFNL